MHQLTRTVVYALSSILAFDPWHMFTSFIPYMLLSPTYINILQMYALSSDTYSAKTYLVL